MIMYLRFVFSLFGKVKCGLAVEYKNVLSEKHEQSGWF